MRRSGSTVLGLAVALALGCAARKVERVSTAQSRELGSNAFCAAGPEVQPAVAEILDGGVALPVPTFQGRILLPPSQPGQSQADITGCLADPSEAAAVRFPAPAETRGGPSHSQVRVNPVPKGVMVAHDLAHACCLTASVESKLDQARVLLVERLSGAPCRCQCASTIRTAIGLAPGEYELTLQLEEGGATRTLEQQRFSVPGP